jgi:predicted nuclease of predicted toxin-antitoxin system
VTRLLLDANLSSETADFLSLTFGFDVSALIAREQSGADDEEVIELAVVEDELALWVTYRKSLRYS